ncbi:MAG: hypothetical protein U0003_02460 [Vampirovibrionales bacterium]
MSMIQEAGVGMVPFTAFYGSSLPQKAAYWLRVSFAPTPEDIDGGYQQLQQWFNRKGIRS